MGKCILKAAPDRDLYLIWSTVVDNAIWVGDRAELVEHLREDHGDSYYNEKRIDRADQFGSSMLDYGFGRWADEHLPVGEGSPDDGWYHLRRDRLAAYAEALLADDEASAVALLECFHRIGDNEPLARRFLTLDAVGHVRTGPDLHVSS